MRCSPDERSEIRDEMLTWISRWRADPGYSSRSDPIQFSNSPRSKRSATRWNWVPGHLPSSFPFPQMKGSGAPSGAERFMAPSGAPPPCFDIRHCRSDRTQEPGYDSDPWHRSLLRFRHVSRNAPYPSRDSIIIIKVPCNVKLRYGAGGRRTSVRLLERICTLPESRRLDANVTTGEAGHRLQW